MSRTPKNYVALAQVGALEPSAPVVVNQAMSRVRNFQDTTTWSSFVRKAEGNVAKAADRRRIEACKGVKPLGRARKTS